MMHEIYRILLEWYALYKRDLPWRKKRDPYAIWVSEIMLQQTRVEAIRDRYIKFMEVLPTISHLASCKEDELAKLWEGLGYYSRAKNLRKAAQICVEKFDAKLPETYEQLLELPGIGPYTAAAIASIAFGENKLAMDGNVMRVFSRLLQIEEDITLQSFKDKIYAFFNANPCFQMGDLNQALMDFGSAICLPNAMVRCNICPLKENCLAYQNHTAHHLPNKKPKKKRRVEKISVVLYVCGNKVLLHKRKNEGLLAGLYEFTTIKEHKTKKDFKKCTYLGKYKHVFSHVEWDMKGFLVMCDTCFESDGIWVDIEDVFTYYSIPSAFRFYKEFLLK